MLIIPCERAHCQLHKNVQTVEIGPSELNLWLIELENWQCIRVTGQLQTAITPHMLTPPITSHTLTTTYHPSHSHMTPITPHTLTCHFLLALNVFSPEMSSLAIGHGEVALSLSPIHPRVFIQGCCNAALALIRYLCTRST